jgi:hypothetical protein
MRKSISLCNKITQINQLIKFPQIDNPILVNKKSFLNAKLLNHQLVQYKPARLLNHQLVQYKPARKPAFFSLEYDTMSVNLTTIVFFKSKPTQ